MDSFRKKLLKGFTLIEVIVVIAIMGILMSGITLAMSVIVRDAKIETNIQKAREALTYVQTWLIELEVRDFDMRILTPYAASASGNNYIQIVSANLATPAVSGSKVTLTAGDPANGGGFTSASTGSFQSVAGLSVAAVEQMANDKLTQLSNSLANTFDGKWRVIINTRTYTAELAYWQSEDMETNTILERGAMFFPTDRDGMTYSQLSVKAKADPAYMIGQYPLAS
jgi:prepilin-type N-terminal cleavage/methylation domain-containing protein